MRLNPQDLEKIANLTLEHYNRRAEDFWAGTRDHDVSQNIEALLRYIEGDPPFAILDFGCGPGRDLKAFAELGHLAVGLEGAARLAVMARVHSGGEVWQQDFLKLDLPDRHFDGVFANAALFHVPSQELPRVLLQLHATLKPRGVLFASNPHGDNEEGWNRGRYGVYHDLENWRRYLSAAGFVELTHYYRPAACRAHSSPGWRVSGVNRRKVAAPQRRGESPMKSVVQILRSKAEQTVQTTTPSAPVLDAVKLMAEKNIGALLVMEDAKVVGIITERDYARKIVLMGRSSKETLVRDIMTSPVMYVRPDHTNEECMALMTDNRVRHLPVMDNDKLIGLISIGDLVKDIISDQKFIIQQLEHYIMGDRG